MTIDVREVVGEARRHWERRRFTVEEVANLFHVKPAELARGVGIPQPRMSEKMNGTRNAVFKPWELRGIAAFFGIEPEVLMMEPAEAIAYLLKHPPAAGIPALEHSEGVVGKVPAQLTEKGYQPPIMCISAGQAA